MDAKLAVAKRILELCEIYNTNPHELASRVHMSPSTLYSMLNTKSMNPGVVSIEKICQGFNISVREFFNTPIFDEN